MYKDIVVVYYDKAFMENPGKCSLSFLLIVFTLIYIRYKHYSIYVLRMLIIIHIGEEFPQYMNDCIAQINQISQIPLHVLIDQKHISLLRGRFRSFPLEGIPIDAFHQEFEDTTRLDPYSRGGFWKYATKRFFYLHTYMKLNGLTDVFHIEYDNLVYLDFTEKLPVFQQKSMWCVLDAEDRCIPSFVYFKDSTITERLLHSCIEGSAQGLNDMQTLANFAKNNSDVGFLPIITNYCEPIPEKYHEHASRFGFLFDAACVGQYIGGVDPRNTPGDTRGFINEKTVFQCDKATVEWKEGKPYLNSFPLVNLHIHSKDLQRWTSPESKTPA